MSSAKNLEDLATRIEQQANDLSQLRHELARLQQTGSVESPRLKTNRRQALRRLAAGLVAGVAVGGGLAAPQVTQAQLLINPAGTNNAIGTIATPPGYGIPAGTPGSNVRYGLVATDGDPSNSLSTLGGTYTVNSGMVSLTAGSASIALAGLGLGQSTVGVYGRATANNSYAVFGAGYGNNGYGIYGGAFGSGTYAGYFAGNVQVTGTLSKSAGSFRIDHPLDPANQYLVHSFVESPDMKNIYDGVIALDSTGQAVVELPGWFESLNSDYRYQLTAIGAACSTLHIAQEVKGGQFTIGGGTPGLKVSWQVTGIRQDAYAKAHRLPVEEAKPAHEKGLYLHPELFGQSAEKGLHRSPEDKINQPKARRSQP